MSDEPKKKKKSGSKIKKEEKKKDKVTSNSKDKEEHNVGEKDREKAKPAKSKSKRKVVDKDKDTQEEADKPRSRPPSERSTPVKKKKSQVKKRKASKDTTTSNNIQPPPAGVPDRVTSSEELQSDSTLSIKPQVIETERVVVEVSLNVAGDSEVVAKQTSSVDNNEEVVEEEYDEEEGEWIEEGGEEGEEGDDIELEGEELLEFDERLESMSTNDIKLLIRDLARGLEDEGGGGPQVLLPAFTGGVRGPSLPSPNKDKAVVPALNLEPPKGDLVPPQIHFPFVKIEGTPRKTIGGTNSGPVSGLLSPRTRGVTISNPALVCEGKEQVMTIGSPPRTPDSLMPPSPLHMMAHTTHNNNNNNNNIDNNINKDGGLEGELGEEEREWGSLLIDAPLFERLPCELGRKCTSLDPIHWIAYRHFSVVEEEEEARNKKLLRLSRSSIRHLDALQQETKKEKQKKPKKEKRTRSNSARKGKLSEADSL